MNWLMNFPVSTMPEATVLRGTLPFDERFLAEAALSDFQRDVASRLLSVAQQVPQESMTAQAGIGVFDSAPGSPVLINFAPRLSESAQMTIGIESAELVNICAGERAIFGLPHEVYDSRSSDVPTFTGHIVSSIFLGRLREKIFLRGGAPVRWQAELDVEGTPIRYIRVALLGTVMRFFRKREIRQHTYAPYA